MIPMRTKERASAEATPRPRPNLTAPRLPCPFDCASRLRHSPHPPVFATNDKRHGSGEPSGLTGFWLLGELKFFIPYKTVLFHEYGTAILVYLATLFLNLFAAAFVLNRKFFLKDTGRKLSHLDKQLHVGQTEVRAPSLEEEVD